MAARVPLPIMPGAFTKKKTHAIQDDDQELFSGAEDLLQADTPAGEDSEGSSSTPAAPQAAATEEEEDEDLTFEEHALIVMAILKPVAVTMFIVIAIVFALHMADDAPSKVSFMIYQETSTDSNSMKLGGALLDAAAFVGMIVVVTFVLVLLYKYRCLKIIYNWLMLSVATLLAFFGGALFFRIFQHFMWPMDWVTYSICVWNFAVVGMFAIFWRAPVRTTQGYLIAISALMAIFFTRLAEWTTWTLLITIAVYDLFAVLCPRGPLKMLVDLSQERGEPIPALLYNGSVVCVGMAFNEGKPSPATEPSLVEPDVVDVLEQEEAKEEESEEPEDGDVDFDEVDSLEQGHLASLERTRLAEADREEQDDQPLLAESALEEGRASGRPDAADRVEYNDGPASEGSVKLGLGDFIFYSVLIGRAAMYDITTVFTCLIAIITGLFLTLILLAIFRKALPALPFSIFLGFIFYFVTRAFLVPYIQLLGANGVFL